MTKGEPTPFIGFVFGRSVAPYSKRISFVVCFCLPILDQFSIVILNRSSGKNLKFSILCSCYAFLFGTKIDHLCTTKLRLARSLAHSLAPTHIPGRKKLSLTNNNISLSIRSSKNK